MEMQGKQTESSVGVWQGDVLSTSGPTDRILVCLNMYIKGSLFFLTFAGLALSHDEEDV
jgi:hypothetical protein